MGLYMRTDERKREKTDSMPAKRLSWCRCGSSRSSCSVSYLISRFPEVPSLTSHSLFFENTETPKGSVHIWSLEFHLGWNEWYIKMLKKSISNSAAELRASCTAVEPRLFELTSSDRLSHDTRHHNTAILYLDTCFLRVVVSKFTVWEPLVLHTHSWTSVNSRFYLGRAKRMSCKLMGRGK